METGEGKKKCHIALLAGADLIQTMSTPGVWAESDIDYILKNFGAFIVEVSLPLILQIKEPHTISLKHQC